jgi:2-aminoadipate transaminase
MLAALEDTFPADASWSRPEGGYFVWLELGAGRSAAELAARAAEEGVAIVQGQDFFPRGSGWGVSAARLAFSYETPERIGEGIARLGALVEGAPASSTRTL